MEDQVEGGQSAGLSSCAKAGLMESPNIDEQTFLQYPILPTVNSKFPA